MDSDLKEVHPKIIQALLDADSNITVEDALENEMVLNMGPQHPATHGVLRLVLRLDGETIVACVPELGYLHRGYEKLAENMTYYEFIPHTDRLDYISPMANNVAWVLAVEKLAGIEAPPVPIDCTNRNSIFVNLSSRAATFSNNSINNFSSLPKVFASFIFYRKIVALKNI